MKSPFIKQLEAIVAEKHLLNHPFYKAWEAGTLPIEVMRKYAEQYYHLEKNFPSFLSKMHASCGDEFAVRQTITENLYDEEHGTENHRELWLKYSEGIGANRHEVENSEAIRETQEAISTFNELSNDYLTGSAALAAYESQIPAVAKTKVKGLEEHYDVSDKATTKFFRVHEVADEKHADAWWKILDERKEGNENKIIDAVTRGRDALWGFLDGIMREYMPEHAC